MFILRRVDEVYGQINTNLGDYYTLLSKEKNPEQFNEVVKCWGTDVVEKIHGVIVFDENDNDEGIMPLYTKSQYYIMTSDGKTFSKIAEK